jgi:hypothetical protein
MINFVVSYPHATTSSSHNPNLAAISLSHLLLTLQLRPLTPLLAATSPSHSLLMPQLRLRTPSSRCNVITSHLPHTTASLPPSSSHQIIVVSRPLLDVASRQLHRLTFSSCRNFIVFHRLTSSRAKKSSSHAFLRPQLRRRTPSSLGNFIVSHLSSRRSFVSSRRSFAVSHTSPPLPHRLTSFLMPQSHPHVFSLATTLSSPILPHATTSSSHISPHQHVVSHALLARQTRRLTSSSRHSIVVSRPSLAATPSPHTAAFVVSHPFAARPTSSHSSSRRTFIVPRPLPFLARQFTVSLLLTLQFRPLSPSSRCNIIVSHPPSRYGFVASHTPHVAGSSSQHPPHARLARQFIVSHPPSPPQFVISRLLLAPCRSPTSNACLHTHTHLVCHRPLLVAIIQLFLCLPLAGMSSLSSRSRCPKSFCLSFLLFLGRDVTTWYFFGNP